MTPSNHIENAIRAALEPLLKIGQHEIDPHVVANLVAEQLDPDHRAPEVITYSSLLHLRDATRRHLRRIFDPVERANAHLEEGTRDMFADTLQDYYPVKRESDGATIQLYTRRELLTDMEAESLCTRMDGASG